jgi:hypothetical protein
VQIKANSDALGAGLLDAKKSEPLSLEEILKKRKEVDDDKERKRKGDERKDREESHGRGERKDIDRERDRDKEVENISAGFIEKPADGYMEEDGEIREFQTEDEVQIKANSDALGAGLLDAKKSEPLSLEEILKKRKEDALQQAKVYAKCWEPNARLVEFCSQFF